MPIAVATNIQQTIRHSPNATTQLQEQQDRLFANKQNKQLLMRQNLAVKSEEEHWTGNPNKPSRQSIGATIVAAGTPKDQPKNVKGRPQSPATQEEVQKALEQSHSNECDYQVCQNGNVTEFFEESASEAATTVADICLVNDHFILVKMPEESLSIYRTQPNESTTCHNNMKRGLNGRVKYQRETNRKLCCCLRSKRNRITKIAPIHEEPENLSEGEGEVAPKSNCLKMTACWQSNNEQEVEMYQTKTNIYKNFSNNSHGRPATLKQSSLSQPSNENNQYLDREETFDIPTVSGSLLKYNLQCNVALHPYGSLLDGQNANDRTLNHLEMINRTRQHRECSRLESFYWLLRPFRRKCRKTEPKIQAIVYKTYFVTWTKPPDALSHGNGVKSVLRRCRSALF